MPFAHSATLLTTLFIVISCFLTGSTPTTSRFPLINQGRDLIPLLVQLCLLILSTNLTLGLAPIRHLHSILKSSFRHCLLTPHVISILLCSIEIPPSNRTFFIA